MSRNFFFFGATGDHAKLKIIPALFQLFEECHFLETKFFAIGRSQKSKEELDDILKNSIKSYFKKVDQKVLHNFLMTFKYLQTDSSNQANYRDLGNLIDPLSQNIFYLSIPPQNYLRTLTNLEVLKEKLVNSSIVLEKPFGLDSHSCQVLNAKLSQLFDENNIYRVDHYLGKPKLNKVLFDDDTRQVFRDIMNRKNLTRIEVEILEQFGVEKRAEFYDKVGALVDVGQNHLLEVLAMIQITTKDFDFENYARLRAKAISDLHYSSSKRGQYKEYTDIENIEKSSQTETYFEVTFRSDKFQNIKFVIRSGKRLNATKTNIIFKFTNSENFIYNFKNDSAVSNEYHFLLQKLLDCNKVNCNFFVSVEELAFQWKLIDEVKDIWNKDNVELEIY
ncbi:hypothetical protein IPJ91_00935 [bacterium]|nr:MAG: hypothetical protein IPJ91_00935 [bacterium]